MRDIKSVSKLLFVLGLDEDFVKKVAANKTNHYKPRDHKKVMPDGYEKIRRIDHPDTEIRTVQRAINKKLLTDECVNLTEEMTGGIKNRSAALNAIPHLGAKSLLSIDISNCFPSITSSMIYSVYTKKLNYSPPVAKFLIRLTSYGDRLPQGSPASPSLCNLHLEPLVLEIRELISKSNVAFTQYIDDFTFSGNKQELEKIQESLINAIQNYGLKINTRKLKLQGQNERMFVTGYVVNNSEIKVGRKFLRKVERDIIKSKNPPADVSVSGSINYIKQTSRKKALKLQTKALKKGKIKDISAI